MLNGDWNQVIILANEARTVNSEETLFDFQKDTFNVIVCSGRYGNDKFLQNIRKCGINVLYYNGVVELNQDIKSKKISLDTIKTGYTVIYTTKPGGLTSLLKANLPVNSYSYNNYAATLKNTTTKKVYSVSENSIKGLYRDSRIEEIFKD